MLSCAIPLFSKYSFASLPITLPSNCFSKKLQDKSQISYNLCLSVLSCTFSLLSSTPAFLAKILKASPNSIPSIFITKSKILCPKPQPKQCHICLVGDTKKDGDFSL